LHFSKLFQIQALFLQVFPKKALAVLWDFKGLQASRPLNDGFSKFFPAPAFPSAPFPPPPRPIPSHRAAGQQGACAIFLNEEK
jgi:hypothetical protein